MDQQPNLKSALAREIDTQTLKFKPKFLGQSPREILDKAHCQICFKFHELKTGRRCITKEPGLDMLQCYGCGVVVHHYCYGIKTPVNEISTDSEYCLKMFVCDKCKFQGPKAVEECAICSQFDGAFKKVSENVYVHVMCALFSQDYKVTDFEKMEIEVDQDQIGLKKRSHLPCVYCKNSNGTVGCNDSSCKEACHPYCAYLNKIKYLSEDEESPFGWKINFTRELNTNEVSVRLLEARVDERVRKIYDRMAGLLENGTQDSGSILKLMKSINQEKKSVLKHAIKKAEEEMIDVYSLLPDYEQSGYIGYSPVEAECEKHRLPDPLCICHSYFDGSKLMFGCDSCENWFHCACLNVPEEDIPEMKEYSCDKCKNWATIKNQFFQKEMIVETSHAVETQDGNGIVPQDTRGFWITDYIITAMIFQNKALKTLSTPSEFKQSIKELIESIEFIPLQLDAIIIQVFETYYTAIAIEEAFLNLFPSQNKIKKALDFSEEAPSTKFGEKKAKKISKVIKQLEDVMDICKQEGVLLESLEAKIVKLISINKWKVDFYRLLGQMPKEESLSEIKSLEERARTLQISPDLPERKHLQTFYNATGEWIVNSTKFFWKKNPLYLHKVKDLKSITINGTTYKVALETLDKNMQALKEDIEAKHSLEELQGFIQQGEMLDSNTKESLSILRKEIEEAETLRRDLKLKPKSLEDVEEKLFKIEAAVIRVPEAIEAITYYCELKKIKLMLGNYVRICESAIEGGQEAPIIDVKEVEEKLHEIEKLQIDFGEEQNILAKKVEEIRAFEALVEKNLSKFVDLEVLKELQRKANGFGFKTSKAFEIQKKYDTVKRMNETFDDFFINNSNEEGTDEDLSFEDSDLEFSPRQNKVSQPKKIEIIEIEDDNCLPEESESQMSDPWLNDLVEFYTTWVLSGSTLSYPKSTESQLEQIQLWIQENVEIAQIVYKHFNEFQKIISKGLYLNYNDERVLTVFIYHAKMYWNFSIKRLISGIYDLQEENLMTLEQLAKQLDNGQSEDHYKLYKELFVDFYEWISTYKALSTSDLYTGFLDDLNINEDQLHTLSSTLHDLLERSAILKIKIDVEEKIKIDVEEKAKDLEKALGHLSWANSAKNLLVDATQRGKLDFELIKMTNIKANMINIPKECSLYKKFSIFLQDLTLYQENLEAFNSSRVFIKTKLAQTSKNMLNSKVDSQIKLLKLQKQKPTLTQGLSLQKSWEEKGYTHDQEEQDEIVKEIRACLDWQLKVKKFFDTYQLKDNEYLELDDVEGIAQGLNKIMTEMIWLILRDDETEILIYQLEWRFHAKLLLNGRERSKKEEREEPGKGVTEWKKLLKIADKRTELGLGNTLLYNLAKEQVEIYNDLMTKISVIKEHDYFLNKALMSPNADIKQLRKGLRQEEDLKLLTKKLLACRIDAQEGRQYLESLLEKIYHIKSCFNELKAKLEALKQAEIGLKASMQRSFKSEARALLIKIHTLPLRLPHEERFLEECEEKSQEYMANTGGVKIQRALYLQEEEKIGSREIQLALKKDTSREELFNNQKDTSLLRKRTDTERDEMEESRITSNKLSNQKLMEEEAFEENEEATRKKLKIQGSLEGQEREQKETVQPNFEKITEKCRTEARRRISDTLRDMKDFDISVKQVKRETITKKLEKCLYHDSGEDRLKYKEKLEKLCNLLRNQRPSTRKTQNAEANHNAVQRGTLTEFYRRRPALEQTHSTTSIPQDGPSPDSLGSDDEMQKKISTRCHSGLCSETGQFYEGGEPNFEIEGIYQPEAWSSEQSYEISMNERVSEHSESTHTEVLSRLTVNSQNLTQNAVPAPILLSLCHLQLNSFITMLPEEKKQKFVSEYKKTSECYSHLFGIPAAPVLAHHQSNPQPQTQTQPEPKTLSSIQHLPRPLLSSTKSQPFPFVRVQSTGQNLECVRGPFMNVDYAGSLRKSQSVVSEKSSLPQQRVLAPSILVNTKSNSSVLDENSKQK